MTSDALANELARLAGNAKEQLRYLHELGVEYVETDDLIQARPPESPTKPVPSVSSISSTPRNSTGKPSARFQPRTSPTESALFEDLTPLPITIPKSLESFEEIWGEIGNCTRCSLHQGRTHIVHTEGNHEARLMFVGEAPGADEDAQARPFVGRAGQLLTRIIEAIGFKREEVLIGNVNRCRPPGNRAPTHEEASICKPFLLREIAAAQPEVIVVLGNTATQNLLDTRVGITRLRGVFQDYQGVKVMPTYHPAYLLRDPSKKQETWEDLKKVRQYLESTRKVDS